MISKFARDKSLRGAKEAYDKQQRVLQEAPAVGWWHVTHTYRRPEDVRFFGTWLKWSCKLLDIGYLRSYWPYLGHYLRSLKERTKESMKSP